MARVLVGVQGNSSRSPSSTLPPSLHEYPGTMPDIGGRASSPALLVATPLQAPRCEAIQCLEHPLLDVRLRPEPG
jgi:hypothetical protein